MKFGRARLKSLALPLVASVVILSFMSLSAPQKRGIEVTDEEYKIYSAILNDLCKQNNCKLFVLEKQTRYYQVPSVSIEYLKKQLPLLPNELLEALVSANKEPRPLGYKLELKTKYVFVTEKDWKAVMTLVSPREKFAELDESKFKRRFPGANGIRKFSRVGFSKDMNQALVWTHFYCGSLCASWDYALLVKQGGEWKVQDWVNVGVS